MLLLSFLFLMSSATVHAEEGSTPWKTRPIEPRIHTDFTAYTVPQRAFRVGLGQFQYGLLDNMQLGSSQFLFLFGIPNASAKITAIQTPKFDVSFQAAFLHQKSESGGSVTTINATPLRWTASWLIHEKVSLHFGTEWLLVDLESTKQGSGIGAILTPIAGADVTQDLDNALGASRYTDAHFSLTQSRFAVDWRLNRRDSVVLQANSYVMMNAMVLSGVHLEPEGAGGQEVDLGGAARLAVPLKETVPAVGSLSWQWSWERFHLRVGIPLSSGGSLIFAIPQAFDLYWVLGGKPKRVGG